MHTMLSPRGQLYPRQRGHGHAWASPDSIEEWKLDYSNTQTAVTPAASQEKAGLRVGLFYW